MKKAIVVIASICLVSSLQAQKKYEKILYKDVNAEGEGISVQGQDAISNKEMSKFKVKITNKTEEIVLYKANESSLKANGKSFKPDEKPLKVPGMDTEGKVINFKGSDFMVTSYSYVMDGLYKVAVTNSIQVQDFQLPPSQNEFKAGNFSCTMSDLKKETDKTSVKFECRYTGDKIGIIQPGRSAVKLPDGIEIANAHSTAKPLMLEKGDTEHFTLVWKRMEGGKAHDMQKINLMILFRNTFEEANLVKIQPVTLDFKIDEEKSK